MAVADPVSMTIAAKRAEGRRRADAFSPENGVCSPINNLVLDIAQCGDVGKDLHRRGEPFAAMLVHRQVAVDLCFTRTIPRDHCDEP